MPSVPFNQNTAASHTVVAAPGVGRFVNLESFDLVCATANTLTIKSGSTVIWGPASFGNNGGISKDGAAIPCNSNEALVFTLGSGAQVGGSVQYSIGGLGS